VLGCLMFGLFGAIQIQLEGVDLPVVGRIPGSLIQMIPYVVTVVVLAGLMAKSVAPKAIGKPFVKSR
jgi:simple sugar transport system permease protein